MSRPLSLVTVALCSLLVMAGCPTENEGDPTNTGTSTRTGTDSTTGSRTETGTGGVADCDSCPPAPPDGHGLAQCDNGKCRMSCDKGWGDCDTNTRNGCEQELLSDAAHCGSCGYECATDVKCIKGNCACAEQSLSATLAPLDLFFLIDRSTSMSGEPDGPNKPGPDDPSRWKILNDSLLMFLRDQRSAGIEVTWQFFPGCNYDDASKCYCDPEFYATHAPFISIPGSNSETDPPSAAGPRPDELYQKSIATKGTPEKFLITGTPTYAAVQGALQAMRQRMQSYPEHNRGIIMMTDGEPQADCTAAGRTTKTELMEDIVRFLTVGRDEGIPTYVVGIGPGLDRLNQLSAAGSGRDAFLISTGGMKAQEDFVTSLRAIRQQLLGCEYAVPKAADGKLADLTTLSVVITSKGNTVKPDRVASADACSTTTGGWYYEKPMSEAPQRLLLCPATCQTILEDDEASLGMELGCAAGVVDSRE